MIYFSEKNKNKIKAHAVSLTGRESIHLHPPSSSSFVLGGQRFAADLLTLVVALLWRFWVGLHVSAVETEEKQEREGGDRTTWE